MRHIYRLKQFIVIISDLIAFFIGLYIALFLRFFTIPETNTYIYHLPLFSVIFLFWIAVNYMTGLYDLTSRKQIRNYALAGQAAILSFIATITILYLVPQKEITPKTILALAVVFGYILSFIFRILFYKIFSKSGLAMPLYFVGTHREIDEMIEIVQKNPEMGYRVAAIFDPKEPNANIDKILTSAQSDGGYLIVSSELHTDPEMQKKLYSLLFTNVPIINHSSFYEVLTGRVAPSMFSEAWFLENLGRLNHPIYDRLSRLFDYIIAVILFVFFIITWPIVAILIKITSRGPIFFIQNRVGLHGQVFKLYKYRSMYALASDGSAEIDGVKFAERNDNRITLFGKFLRKSRLDELPQCLNLLKGDLTLIGPRPERPEIVSILTEKMPYYSLRHIVKPGITGWAVVRQNYTADLESSLVKLQYDLFYIKNRSWLLDMSIVLRTVNLIVRMLGQ
ncbi:MAG TPA: exopolysaccharide biosynthesis polyprenyl glycosylphosphotransferase [Candidatus Magasanikbacteria bacterium]|nr:exopolysaccharide biosynthesis polyprenyl glycosylphosphotransferase [Candidatus Magasanikbacteria bacterium]